MSYKADKFLFIEKLVFNTGDDFFFIIYQFSTKIAE